MKRGAQDQWVLQNQAANLEAALSQGEYIGKSSHALFPPPVILLLVDTTLPFWGEEW